MSRVFISYKRADKDKVFPLKDKIEAAIGEPCWIDLDGIESDAQFISVIIRAINECEVFLFMYSRCHSKIVDFEQDWTVREINLAQKKRKRIVFVNLDNTPLSDFFEMWFGFKQQVDATSESSFNRLLEEMKRWLGIEREPIAEAEVEWLEDIGAGVITSKNYRSFLSLDVAGFDFAFGGAMGDAGGVNIVTTNGDKYYTNYGQLSHYIEYGELLKVLPIITKCELPAFGNATNMPEGWEHISLGAGNNLILQKQYLDLLIREVWHDCPDINNCQKGTFYQVLTKLQSWSDELPRLLKEGKKYANQ